MTMGMFGQREATEKNKKIEDWKFYDRNENLKLEKIGRYPEETDSKGFNHEIYEWEFYDNNTLVRTKRFNYETQEWEFYDKQGNKINWSDE